MQYILYDVDKIKDYVFDSFKPKEVKGASNLIKCLDYDRKTGQKEILLEKLTGQFPGLEIVYSKGGGGLLTCEASQSRGDEICSWLENHYPQHVPDGNITAVSHPGFDFRESLAILNYKLRERKAEKILGKTLSQVQFTVAHPRCVSCGKRPAESQPLIIANEKMYYCSTCKEKREYLEKYGSDSEKVEALEQLADIDKENCPRLSHIKSTNQILIIYGDLNEAGAHLASLQNKDQLARFSDTVYDVLDNTRKDIEKILDEYGFKYVMPIIGGDDMLIFTHPNSFQLIKERLFSIETTLQEKLEKSIDLQRPVRMNFSFLLARYSLPIYHLFNISSALLEKTKEAYYRDKDENKQTYYGFTRLWQGDYHIHEHEVYTREDFRTLLDMAEHIHGPNSRIKRSSLYQLLELISGQDKDREKCLNTEYYLARHSEYEKFAVIKNRGEEFKLEYEQNNIPLTAAVLEDIIEMENLLFNPPTGYREEK